ncbi:hypothetical protein M4D57_18590 [Brevibacillus borstelensis]|uniref:hypothetical protein n=1 Tax=Brevibacillus borstelensis TaxID=45462 RepID=UPI002040C41A|nr:hypothetical protein [Brevibacillus borstelensis]MCM3560577.1 hypothetical protein [Brevibacillus borstelensis]
MSYQKNTWIDHIIDPSTGEVIQQGTKVTANRLNKLEGGVEKAHQLIESLAREWGGSFVTAQAGRNPGLVFSVAGLTASWTAGVAYVNGVRFDVASGSIALNASQGQYIYLDSDGIVKKTTSQATANAKCPLWYFATDASGVITSTDRRNIVASSITVDQNQAPTGNTGNWWKFFSFFANRLKQFSGETDWKTDPIRSLKQLWTDLSNHLSDTVSHITAAERTAWNAKETPEGAQTKVDNHASATSVHGATSAATASRIIMRDANGRAKVAAPSAADDIARKDTVDAVQANLNNHIGTGGTAHAAATTSAAGFMSASDKSKLDGATSAATSSTLIMRDANGRAKVAAPAAPDDIARKAEVDAIDTNKVNRLADEAFTEASSMSEYPRGISVFFASLAKGSWLGKAQGSVGFVCVETYRITNTAAAWGIQRATYFGNTSTYEVWQRAVGNNTAGAAWGPWVRVDRGISYGTAAPSGGRDGDIYFQYE